ncbi:MAG: folate-binding protein [Myxococcales bacterium]|nr:MAG: folate-binding protein [Myxococcales bacterium]
MRKALSLAEPASPQAREGRRPGRVACAAGRGDAALTAMSGSIATATVATWLEERATLVVTGSDRLRWLNGLVTCNLAPLTPGQGAYGLATSKVGRILADVFVVLAADRMLVGCPVGRAAELHRSLESYLIMEDVEVEEASSAWRWLALHGPDAPALAARAAADAAGHAAPLFVLDAGDAVAVVPAASVAPVSEAVAAAGAPVLAPEAWEQRRVALGIPRFGVDFDEKTYPQEAALERRAVSFQKGCYLGQEVVCRLEMRGHVHRRLTRLALASVPAPGATVATEAGEAVGLVTSATALPDGTATALAMVKYAHSEPGTALRVGDLAARVASPDPGPLA